MTIKRANWLFLTIILTHIGVALLLYFGGSRFFVDIVTNFLLSEGILMIPTALFLFASARRTGQALPAGGSAENNAGGLRPFEAAAFHRVKISTLLMIALCTFLIMPLVVVLNALSMFFVDNALDFLQGDIESMPFSVMLLMIGIVAPFCEEFVFRGVIYRSYRGNDRNGNNGCYAADRREGLRAVLLSAFLFGLMHMNYNQMIYAFAMGIFLALLVEAAGSLWASVFCHMFFNSVEVVLMYVSSWLQDSIYGQTAGGAVEPTTRGLLTALSFYLIIAAVTTPIAGCIIVWIAKNEGRQQAFSALFFRRKKQGVSQQQNEQEPYYLLSVPLVVAIVLCLGFMSLEFFLF